MATFGEMKAQIKRDLVRGTELSTDENAELDDDTIEFYIKSAINYYRRKPFFFNEDVAILTTVADQRTLGLSEGLPSDFITDIALVQDSDNYTVSKVSFDFMLNEEQSIIEDTSPTPIYYTFFNEEMRVYPSPSNVFTMTFYYTKELAALSGDSSTNAWTEEGERMVRSRSMADIYAFRLHDPQRATAMYSIAQNEESVLMEWNNSRNASGQLTAFEMI